VGSERLTFSTVVPIQVWPEKYLRPVLFLLEQSWYIAIAAMLLLSWLRRHRASPQEVCATHWHGLRRLFGFSDYWAFQYFAWALPFLVLLRWWFSPFHGSAHQRLPLLLQLAFLRERLLLGKWDFLGHSKSTIVVLIISEHSRNRSFLLAHAFSWFAHFGASNFSASIELTRWSGQMKGSDALTTLRATGRSCS